MTSLKQLIEENKLFNYEDIEIIKKWFIENNFENLGLQMIPELAAIKAEKIQKQLDYARSWIPVKIDVSNDEYDFDTAQKLNKIITYCMLSMDLPEILLNWARENILKMNLPKLFFIPTIDYLRKKYSIEFKDRSENF
nr:MAG TPA: hypothetical protein [Caudoviricetes sp.]